jgi:hypothetical protein
MAGPKEKKGRAGILPGAAFSELGNPDETHPEAK